MIKIDWKRLLIERGFMGFHAYMDATAEPGADFVLTWGISPWKSLHSRKSGQALQQ